VCQSAATSSVQSPRMAAAMVVAADNAPVNAMWTPEEKNGSMKQPASPTMRALGKAYMLAL